MIGNLAHTVFGCQSSQIRNSVFPQAPVRIQSVYTTGSIREQRMHRNRICLTARHLTFNPLHRRAKHFLSLWKSAAVVSVMSVTSLPADTRNKEQLIDATAKSNNVVLRWHPVGECLTLYCSKDQCQQYNTLQPNLLPMHTF